MRNLSDCRILLVDDTKANIDILIEALKQDYKLSVALNGESALQIAEKSPPDLILLDIIMPGLDGYEVCRRLRKTPATAEIPVVFLSALDEARDKARGFEAGANDFVSKPFDPLEVQARVRSLLKAKAYNDAIKEQLAADLRIASQIQMGMITHEFEDLEKAFDIELASVLEPAREVGGDLFNVFEVESHRLFLLMGDVSGKGIPASLFMMRATTLARLLARQIQEPKKVLEALNNELAADNPSCMFVTLVCALFDRATSCLTLANGGHTRPLLLRAGEPPRYIVPGLGTALGFEADVPFSTASLQLQTGDSLIFYTDGVTEAFNSRNECYGDDRLLAALDAGRNLTASALVKHLRNNVHDFAAETPQSDDIAILAMRVQSSREK